MFFFVVSGFKPHTLHISYIYYALSKPTELSLRGQIYVYSHIKISIDL